MRRGVGSKLWEIGDHEQVRCGRVMGASERHDAWATGGHVYICARVNGGRRRPETSDCVI